MRRWVYFPYCRKLEIRYSDRMDAEPGDKVRLKTVPHEGARGVVQSLRGEDLVVRLDVTGREVRVQSGAVTNYSLAARKAWERMPDRRVGRPKGSGTSNRVSVTLRIDRELWSRFRQAESAGTIRDRTATLNAWISEKLDELDDDMQDQAS